MQLCREGKEKEDSPPSRAAAQRPALASLPAPAAGAAGPRIGRPALALPALEAGSGVAQKLAAVELKPSSRCPVGGGAGCQPAACGAENCCCLFSFFSFLRGNCCLTRARMQAASQIFFYFDTSSKPNLVMGWIGKFSVHAEREGRPVSFPSKSSMGHAGLNARRRDKQRKLAKS